jgi:hypothetical protein
MQSACSACRGLATELSRPCWRGPHGTSRPASEALAGAQRRPTRQRAHVRPECVLVRLRHTVHEWNAGCGAVASGQRLIVSREGLAGGDHWTTATLHGRVLRPSSSRTVMAMRGRCSLVVMLYSHRNRGAHCPTTVGVASPRQEGAPGPAHEGGRWVRRLGTAGVAETEAERGGDGLSESRREAAVGAWTK